MGRRFSVNFAVFSMFLDGVLIAIGLSVAADLRWALNGSSLLRYLVAPTFIPTILYYGFPLIWVGILLLFSVYDGRKNLSAVDEFSSLTLGTALAAVSMAGVLYLTYRDISRALFAMFIVLGYSSLLLWRGVARLAYHWSFTRSHGAQGRRVLIIGAGELGRRLKAEVESNAHLGLVFVGFLDDAAEKSSLSADILGGCAEVREFATQLGVDDIVISLPRSAYRRLNRLVAVLHDLPVKVWVIPDYFSLALHRASVEEFAGLPMLDLRAPALSDGQRMVKRIFDLSLTLVLMPLTLGLMALVALAIRVDGPGPVLFRQKRVGENGRLFDMLKFRTMVPNADGLNGDIERMDQHGRPLQMKSPADPRLTRVGRFLRRTSLDELPQLFNVLRGDMSLIGPRPELPHLVEKYELWQRKRFAVPQGMTGWWQVNGRSDRPMFLHTEDDLYYVQHYSLWLDLRILVRTVGVVLRGKGAY